jgi:hypothetical protein
LSQHTTGTALANGKLLLNMVDCPPPC